MPIYEFKCNSCGKVWEELLKMGDYWDPYCPDCMASARRILSPVFSNFSKWSDTLGAKGRWAAKPEDFGETR